MTKEKSQGSNMMESTTLEPVPKEDRKSWVNIAFITAGGMICVPSLVIGGMLVAEMSLASALLAGTIGYILTVLLGFAMGVIGSDIGRPTCMTAVPAFGGKGTQYIVSILFTISLLGWYGLQNNICGPAFSQMMMQICGIDIPVWVSSLIWGIIMLITALYGINALEILNKISVPALIIVTIYGTYLAAKTYGTDGLTAIGQNESMSVLSGALMTFSFMTVVSILMPDVTRYQKTRADVFKSNFIGIMPAGLGLLALGCVLTGLAGNSDITLVLSDLGIPVLGMIVLILSTWTTNTLNAYGAGLNVVMMFNLKESSRGRVTLISGSVGTILAVLGILDHLALFIDLLGATLTPMAGVIMADYFILKKGRPESWKYTEGFNWIGIASWIIGFALTKLIPSEWALVIDLIGAGAVHVVLTKVLRKENA
ncbi:MAG: cytosine permease [Firmicutes bacterium]|nr:cytosine permease [Bacillota bacterium]